MNQVQRRAPNGLAWGRPHEASPEGWIWILAKEVCNWEAVKSCVPHARGPRIGLAGMGQGGEQ